MKAEAGQTRARILVLTSTFPRWQGDNEPPFVFELCRRLGDEFDLTVLAPHAPGAMRYEWMEGIEVVRFRYGFSAWERMAYQGGILANLKRSRWCYLLLPLFFLSQLTVLRRIVRYQHIDVIHAHWLIPQGLTVAIASLVMKNGPPMICTSHGGDLLGLNGWLLRSIKRWVIRRSAQLTVVSRAMAAYALSQGARPERLHTISMGVDTINRFTPDISVSRATNELLFVGRLVEKKGCAYLLAAMPEILRHFPDTRLSIVGSGAMKKTLKWQVENIGIAHAVTFHCAVNNAELPNWYRRATIFIAPSIVTSQGDQEGLGLVLVEALACGCPVIASDLPAIQDVVIDGVTGVLVQHQDSAGVARAVVALLAAPERRRQLAEKGRDHVVRNFDWTSVAARYRQLLSELI